jgi:large subunit ribosomal protein L7/L12
MDLTKNQQQVIDLVKEMSAVELNGLVKALEEEFGVTAAAMVVAGGAAGGAATDAGAGAGSDSVNVELTEAGQQKIAVIKVVKEVLGIDLKAAKELVEAAPKIIKENVKTEEAEALKAKLTEAGATVNFK